MKKIYSVNTVLNKITGIQRVMMDIHHAVKDDYESWIVGTMDYNRLNPNIGIERNCYIKFRNPFMFYHSIVIIHERKLLPVFWVLNHLLFQRIKLVYVHHNLFYDNKRLSLFPETVVAISDEGVRNLNGYFKVPMSHIKKIHNCVRDTHPVQYKTRNTDKLTIIYPARINTVKRQCEIVEHLKGKLDERINIVFAGMGPLFEILKSKCGEDKQFKCLGFCSDIYEWLQKSDFVMLFSVQEGLPITLIEATMCGIPIICNNVGGNIEIAHDGENAFVVNKWDELIDVLNKLVDMDNSTYKRMSGKSRRIYEKYYTFDRFKKEYITLLKQV